MDGTLASLIVTLIRESQLFVICLCNTGVLGKTSLGKKEFLCRKRWREGEGNSGGRRKEREREKTNESVREHVCICTICNYERRVCVCLGKNSWR